MQQTLAGRRVLLTRPAGQNEMLAQAIRSRGGVPVELPMFEIVADGEPQAHRLRLDQARDWDGWIFSSANAARHAAVLDPGPWPALFAIGAATRRALAEAGHAGAQIANQGSDSEALLELQALKTVGRKRFLLCTGAGGRDLIETTLLARGARLERLDLYRRLAIDYPEPHVRAALKDLDAVICTSGEGLERLLALAPTDTAGKLFAGVLVVPSPRVLELARRRGFVSVSAPAQTSDEAFAHCLEQTLTQAPDPTLGSAHRPP